MNTKVLCSAIAGLLVLAMMSPVAAFADDDDGRKGRCELQGSWMGYDSDGMAFFLATHSGASSKSGISMIEVPGFDFTLGGMYSTAGRSTVGRGAWEKIGKRTYGWTGVGLVVDSEGNTLYLWKIAAVNKINKSDPGCDTVLINNTVEFFGAFDNPFEDTPFFTIYGNPHTAMRITIDPPAVP